MMSDLLTVSEAARELERDLGIVVRPRTISDLFYQRQVPEDLGPIVGGRRLIPREALPAIREFVRQQADATGVTKIEDISQQKGEHHVSVFPPRRQL